MGDLVTSLHLPLRFGTSRNERYELVTWTSITVRGIVTQYTAREIAAAPGVLSINDLKIYVSRKDLTVDITTKGICNQWQSS